MKKTVAILLAVVLVIGNAFIVNATQDRTANFYTTFALSGNPATDVVRVAEAQLGRNRASMGYTEAWCANFVNDCAKLINIPDNVIPHNYSSRGGCGYLIRYMLNYCNATLVTTPQTGDMVFWHCTTCDLYPHVGFVYDSLHSIEGNGAQGYVYSENGHVIKRTLASSDTAVHSCGARLVKKYVRPNYSSVLSATLDAQGGECKDACQYLKYGGYIGTLPTPVRTGFTFNGWFSEPNGKGAQYTADMQFWGLNDVTWYASWTANGNVDIASGSFDNITWRRDANNNLFFEGTGVINQKVVTSEDGITSIYIGEGITGVADQMFSQNGGPLESVSLPSTLKSIGFWSFGNATSLKNVNLPDGLESIGAGAFTMAVFEALEIPNTVTEIGYHAFSHCTELKSVKLPANLQVINNYTFYDCPSLESIDLPETITTIGNSAFSGCKALTSVTIPENVTSIGNSAFKNCTNLTDVYLFVTEDEWENNVTVGEEAFPETVTFHFKESYLDFKVIENESNTVTLSWNRDEYSYAYDVTVYDEFGFLLESHSVDAEDAVDGVVTTTFNLRGGNYRAEIVCLNTAGIIITDEVSFTVEMTDADNYVIDALYGSVSEGRFYAEVEVVNVTDREEADTVIIAVYKDDEMIDFVYMKTDLPKGQTVTFGGMLEGVEGATLKAFVWDSIQGMKALSNVVEK